MAENYKITEKMKSSIGWLSDPWTYEVSRTGVRSFARGVGYTDPVYYDTDAAKKAGYRDLPAPPTYLGTPIYIPGRSDKFFSSLWSMLDHGLDKLLDGGTETEYFDTICAGDTLTYVCKLTELFTKESKTTGTMLVIVTEDTYTNQDGKVAAVQISKYIFY